MSLADRERRVVTRCKRGRDCGPAAFTGAPLGGRSTSPLDDVMLRIATRPAVPYHARPGSLGFATEVSHATQERTHRRHLLSRSSVSDARDFPQRHGSNADLASLAVTKNSVRSSAATTHAPACQAADFKNCCMLSGEFDGSDRHHFFQRVMTSSKQIVAGVGERRVATSRGRRQTVYARGA